MHHGQEIYSFFYSFGIKGFLGIIISTILLGLIIYKTLILSKRYGLNSYNELLDKIIKKEIIKKIIKIIINIFLISSFYIMIAGFAAYFYQEYHINKIFSSIFLIILCYMMFKGKVEKIIKINTILVPIMIIIFIIFGVNNLKNITNVNISEILENNNSSFIISGIIYTSYNSITLIGLTGAMNQLLKNKKDCFLVTLITSIIIMSLAIIIYLLLINVDVQVEIPMLYVANKFGGGYKYLYSITILMAIFTTAISTGYSFLENISKGNKRKYKIINIIMCALGVPISLLGFANLVNIIYPIFGIIGLIQIVYILLYREK